MNLPLQIPNAAHYQRSNDFDNLTLSWWRSFAEACLAQTLRYYSSFYLVTISSESRCLLEPLNFIWRPHWLHYNKLHFKPNSLFFSVSLQAAYRALSCPILVLILNDAMAFFWSRPLTLLQILRLKFLPPSFLEPLLYISRLEFNCSFEEVPDPESQFRLPVLTITDFSVQDSNKQVILLVAGEHARELITSEIIYWLSALFLDDTAWEPASAWTQISDIEKTAIDKGWAKSTLKAWARSLLQKIIFKVLDKILHIEPVEQSINLLCLLNPTTHSLYFQQKTRLLCALCFLECCAVRCCAWLS